MRRIVFAGIVTLASAVAVHAAGFGLKPGLWELHVVKQTVNGQDNTAQIAGASARMQQAMANLPPEQRARMEEMMKQRGFGTAGSGGFRICVSPEMAQRDRPIIDREGRCQPSSMSHSGNTTSFAYSCNVNGESMTGKGSATASGDLIAVSSDVTTSRAGGPPSVMHNETELRFLGSDCGDVKPAGTP
jgi:hypothetical protein